MQVPKTLFTVMLVVGTLIGCQSSQQTPPGLPEANPLNPAEGYLPESILPEPELSLSPLALDGIIRINAGGPEVSIDGVTWSRDVYYSDSRAYINRSIPEVAHTRADELYLTERVSNIGEDSFSYSIPLAAGHYEVRLHFAEIWVNAPGGGAGGAGSRVFDVALEGEQVLSNYDVYAEVGAAAATIKSFDVLVEDGELELDFSSHNNYPKISALEIIPSDAAPPGQPPAGATGPDSRWDHLTQIYVSPRGRDGNAGTTTAPIRTLNEGLRRAITNRNNGKGTRLLLSAGTYRESIDGYYGSRGAPIVIESVETGKAIVSGSDIWTDWSCSGSVCSHHWSYKWGFSANPWPQANIAPIGLRQELIFVNGNRLEQRLSLSEVQSTPGTFFVDEGAERVHLRLPSGVSMGSATVEVGVRPQLLWLQGLHDLVIKGVVFQHAPSPIGWAALDIVDQNRVLLEDVTVQQNNWGGLQLKGNDFVVRRLTANHNGGNGMGAFMAQRLLIEDSETSYNNWRGYAGGLTGWSVGQKFLATRDLTIRRHTSTNNFSRGLWIDTDNENTLIEDVLIERNLRGGLFIEKSQGPITVRNSTIRDNGQTGLLTSAVHNFTFEHNVVSGNSRRQLTISGDFDVRIKDFVTNKIHTLNNQNWRWHNNRIVAEDGSLLFFVTHPTSRWNALLSSWQLNHNTYVADHERAFQPAGVAPIDFAAWKPRTSKDGSSTFTLRSASRTP